MDAHRDRRFRNPRQNIALASGTGQILSCTVVALLHSGISQADETQAYTLIKTAQILAGQTARVNAIRIRTKDIMDARDVATRIEAQTGYKAVSWQEANEDLLSAFQIRISQRLLEPL